MPRSIRTRLLNPRKKAADKAPAATAPTHEQVRRRARPGEPANFEPAVQLLRTSLAASLRTAPAAGAATHRAYICSNVLPSSCLPRRRWR